MPAVLEPIAPAHAAGLWHAVDTARDDLRQWLSWVDGLDSLAAARRAVEIMIEARRCNRQWTWVIAEDAEAHGLICAFPREDEVELTYWLVPAARGRGLARRVVTRLVDHLQRIRGPVALTAHIAEHNMASAALVASLGFVAADWLEEPRVIAGHRYRQRLWHRPVPPLG